MSKLLPFLVAGVGASSVSVGGVFMLKKTGGNGVSEGRTESNTNGDSSQQGTSTSDTSKDLEFDSLTNFEKKGGTCVKELFGQERNLSTATGSSTNVDYSSIADTLNPISSSTKTNNKSCLIINYEKKGETDKGTGTFTWTGAFANETKGFVVFVLAKTPNPPSTPAEQKMTIDGGFYILSKDNGQDGQVTGKQTVGTSNSKTITKANLTTDKHLPKPANGLQDATQSYGDFISGDGDLDKICKEATCPTTPFNNNGKYKERWMGIGQDSGGKKPYEGCEDMDWFKGIFGDSNNKLKSHLDTLTGTWTKQTTTPSS